MSKNFIPSKESELLAWAANFSAKITATPTAYGLTAPQATAFASLNTAFATALNTATNPATRTRGTIAAKNAARTPMIAQARDLARIVSGKRDDKQLGTRVNNWLPSNLREVVEAAAK